MLSALVKHQSDANWPVEAVGHFIIFAGLGVSVGRYFSKEFAASPVLGLALTLLSCAFFGLCDEVYQSLVPGRTAQLGDLFVDCLGALAGGLAYLILLRKVCGTVREETTPLRRIWPFGRQI
ncbi:MAG: VanZ family protein [Desulfomonile tiedjei]|nr:VanZ family protein [Desulfomonile tiedjei]